MGKQKAPRVANQAPELLKTDTVGGLDLSWTGLGACALTGDAAIVRTCKTHPADFTSALERLSFLRAWVLDFCQTTGIAWLLTEGYAFGSTFGREQAGELGGAVRLALWEQCIPFGICAPTALKKFVTGKGVADKAVMMREVFRLWGFSADDDNQNDAYALARLAQQVAGIAPTARKFDLTKIEIVRGRQIL